ncbi:MAG: hypothetical protein Q8Q09_25725 [Deltaproteobacteria bacterium]|nr:hypothetical protein [Deltaproteobacteria bacterium]
MFACAVAEPPSDARVVRDAAATDGAPPGDVAASDAESFDSGRECSNDMACVTRFGTPLCDPVRGRCVACTPSNDRCDPADHCDAVTFTCAPGCHADDGCAGATPRCDTDNHRCVECTASTHCPGGASCVGARCSMVTCPANRADCNRNAADMCEVDLTMDPNHCGACGAMPTETCNLRDDNCNGRCDELAGCRVGVHRSSGVEHFYTTNRTEAACCGFTVEFENFFYLYGSMAPGTSPLRRCYSAAQGRHLMTTAADCEGFAPEGIMGYIGTSATCGAVPLYRLYNPSNRDNFFTTSAPERDNAVNNLGYQARELVGYVWTRPQGM